jgi:hypothetical protein
LRDGANAPDALTRAREPLLTVEELAEFVNVDTSYGPDCRRAPVGVWWQAAFAREEEEGNEFFSDR